MIKPIPADYPLVRTPQDLKKLRELLDISQAGLAALLQISVASAQKYEASNRLGVPEWVTEACSHMVRCCRTVQQSPHSLIASTKMRYEAILEQHKKNVERKSIALRKQRNAEQRNKRREHNKEIEAQKRRGLKDLLANQRAELHTYQHEGDRRSSENPRPSDPVPSLDELFS